MIALFFIIAAVFVGLLHVIIYEATASIFGIYALQQVWALRVSFIILALIFPAAAIISNYRDGAMIRLLHRTAVVWLGLATYLFLASVIYGIVFGVISRIPSLVMSMASFDALGFVLFAMAFVTTGYGLIHARHIVVTDVKIQLPRLPEAWKSRTAVLMSDLHLGHVLGRNFAARVTSRVDALKPDIVFIVGDLYDGVRVDEADIISPLSGLRAPLGTFFVTGNHEEFRDNGHFLRAIRAAGIRVLMNESVDIDGLQLIGALDRDSTDKEKFPAMLAGLGIDPGGPSILLKHQPDLLSVAEKAGISLQLSGHTHKAQMYPLSYITKWVYHGRDYGLHRFGTMQIYTSSGVGTWGPPLRVGTKAEIVRISFI